MERRGASLFFILGGDARLSPGIKRYNLPCIPTAGVGDPRSQFLYWLHSGGLSRQQIPMDCSPVLINFVDGLTLICHRNLSVAHYLGCTSGSVLFLYLSYRNLCCPKHSPSHETPCLLLSFHCTESIMTISRTQEHLPQNAHSVISLANTWRT